MSRLVLVALLSLFAASNAMAAGPPAALAATHPKPPYINCPSEFHNHCIKKDHN